MRRNSKNDGWNPYMTGALVGLLAIVSVIATTQILGKTDYLGASTTFVRAAGFLEQTIMAERVATNEYFTKTKILVDWQFMLVVGIVLGAFISSAMDKSFKLESVPSIWEKRFGPSILKRAVAAIAGGVVAMMGARLAGGCPSGHGLSGMMKLSVSSLVAMVMFFGVGVLVARIIYGRRES